MPGFFDVTYAYRFGPRVHDVTVATLLDAENNCVIAESVHFPAGLTAPYSMPTRDIGLEVTVEKAPQTGCCICEASSFAQFLHIDDPHFQPDDNWLHLPPRAGSYDRAAPDAATRRPCLPARVTALNADRVVRYAGRS